MGKIQANINKDTHTVQENEIIDHGEDGGPLSGEDDLAA